jgi:hypothetical protein
VLDGRPVVYRGMAGGYRQAIVSMGITADTLALIARNNAMMDRAGKAREDWSGYESDALDMIRVLGR